MIQLQNIEKYYANKGLKSYILRHVSTTIQQGEFVSIMGPSGAGKSTLLNILGMLEEPTYGSYEFMGENVVSLNERRRIELYRNHIGFVFQAYHLIDEMTVAENIEAPLLYKKVGSAERKSRVAEMLDRFNMVAKKDLFPNQLSGGQQQLVGIARALAAQPLIILADEPTGNLQSAQALQIMDLFKKLNEEENITIIQVTHSEINAGYGTRILHLLDGVISEDLQVVV
ncbi:ABC-type lipoprotein export system ATPase subunit [Pedobacter cryoconitis]|uniref:ABC-type lipoprotein export system ATPase subunit n=1 Tax=Pedobacter cryoconitis TaxID=188932 RepID=A0A7W8YUJ1_9SPHI|nr:ABC transporter ATP-binding protein [Pedobacter cryoconitis]MBB5622023.1 ABC-type lipoprotein export system ATPase subunit [Pedobacter cryoconitis]MBB5646804.1 ABC-type lipoprotein export system ATPase subunit [Pedobacter cryoconitis]